MSSGRKGSLSYKAAAFMPPQARQDVVAAVLTNPLWCGQSRAALAFGSISMCMPWVWWENPDDCPPSVLMRRLQVPL